MTRRLAAAILLLLCTPAVPPAHAALRADALAVDAADALVGVLHALGAHLRLDAGPLAYSCPALGATGDRLIPTGAGRVLVTGPAGVALSFDTGCKWRAMLGAAAVQPIVGAHGHPTAPNRVVFALGGVEGAKLAVTLDGGFTSDLLASLVIAQTRVTGMVGQGERLLVVAVNDAGEALAWSSPDFGNTVAPVPLGLVAPLGDDPVPAALATDQDAAFLWFGGALHRWDLSDGVVREERVFSRVRAPASADGDGALWLAGGAEGLWRRGVDGAWSLARAEPAWSVEARRGRVWVGGAARGDEPWVLVTADGGLTFDAVASAPGEARYPPECASLAVPTCQAAAAQVGDALELGAAGAEVAEVDDAPRADDGGCGGAGAGPGAWWAAWLAGLACIRRRRDAP